MMLIESKLNTPYRMLPKIEKRDKSLTFVSKKRDQSPGSNHEDDNLILPSFKN